MAYLKSEKVRAVHPLIKFQCRNLLASVNWTRDLNMELRHFSVNNFSELLAGEKAQGARKDAAVSLCV